MVDFKSGFGSNEKGNTNRLLLVASIYASMSENYRCMIFVRSSEDENNHYLQTLINSGIWDVYCADQVLSKTKEITGFDIKNWIEENINWEQDLDESFFAYLKDNNLEGYLKW